MHKNARLYEINTRIWIKKLGAAGNLSSIPPDFFSDLKSKGIDYVWLMGVWKTCTGLIDKCCFSVDLVSAYNKAVKDWQKEEIIGSPYSIDKYELNPSLGSMDDLRVLRKKLNDIGIRLILDFIPNHFGADSELIKTMPEIFLSADEEQFTKDTFTFFRTTEPDGKIFAHGRDPFFLAWTDTIQINFFCEQARKYLINTLLQVADVCDGVRCDMAMLPLNNVFYNTWVGVLNKFNIQRPQTEFWQDAIQAVKNKFPGFIFIGEAYWDLEWYLQKLGFDFTYDKRLTDRLAAGDIAGVKAHLLADNSYQDKLVRFLENHDEPRAVAKFGKERSMAAAVVINTINGMKLFYDGQFDGRKISVPVQMGREPEEKLSGRVKRFYINLLKITSEEVFISGIWMMLEPLSAGGQNMSFHNFFAWKWELMNEIRVVIINFSGTTSQCRLRFEIKTEHENVILTDQMNNESYTRSVNEIRTNGLFVELKGFNSHIFKVLI